MSPIVRLATLVLSVSALAVVAVNLPLSTIPDAVATQGTSAPVIAVLVGAALLIALMPRTPISLACGLLFGAGTGVVVALLVALAAAAATFAAGRLLGRDFVARWAGRRWRQLEQWISREGVLAVAAVRALPLGPYGLAGYAYGASGIALRPYALGTLISATPSAISYALVGSAVARPGSFEPISLVPLGFGLALSAAVLIRARRARRGLTPPATDTASPPHTAAHQVR
ncbi:MAG TPA: VTT domain-containing protein [Micromonosporaceae bacterium]